MTGPPEPDPMESCGEGQIWAWIEELYRQQAAGLVHLARASGFDKDEARAIVHDAFLGLERRLRSCGPLAGRPVPYLVTSDRNEIKRRLQRGGRMQLIPVEEIACADPNSEEDLEKVLVRYDNETKLKAGLQAVEALPLYLRQVYVLCEMYDYPAAEVARILEKAPGTVRHYLHLARRQVRADAVSHLQAGGTGREDTL